MRPPHRVGLVGLGTIAATHVSVLRDVLPGARLIGVDPRRSAATAAGGVDEVHADLTSALAGGTVDLWVVATPTSSHVGLAIELLRRSEANLLVEKPLVTDGGELLRLEAALAPSELRSRVSVSHHFAFSPEIRWAVGLRDRLDLGPMTRATSTFHDPYVTRSPTDRASYGDPWTDSGPNQLSMLLLLAGGPIHLDEIQVLSDGCRAQVHGHLGEGGPITAVTSWRTASSSKESVLAYGDVEVWLDHTAVTGLALRDGRVIDSFDTDGTVPRKVLHYRPLYESLFSPEPAAPLGYDFARRVVQLLWPPA